MSNHSPLATALSHPVRWHLMQSLAVQDLRVGELSRRLKRPINLVSYHLKALKKLGFLHEHRSQADGRDIYYQLDLAALKIAYRQLGLNLHPSLAAELLDTDESRVSRKPHRVLFLCSKNSARSQMAEAFLKSKLGSEVEVHSAGTEPGQVHPLAVATMAERGLDIANQESKHYRELNRKQFDVVVTVCDRAREECPAFPGAQEQLHWSVADPVRVVGSEEFRREAFQTTAAALNERIDALIHHLSTTKGSEKSNG